MNMIRKLVKQGAATLMISLPAKWLKSHNLEKGAEISIEEANSNLIITATTKDMKLETEIKLTNLVESSIRTLITNTYRRGFDRVRVHFDSENQFRVLKDVVKTRLIGFDIIKKDKNACIVENITEPSAEQFDTLINKIFFNTIELFESAKRIMNGEADNDFEEIEERIQNYDNFCRRVISKKKAHEHKSEFFWTFLALFVHGQREIYQMNKSLGKNAKVSPKTKELLNDCLKMMGLIRECYAGKKINLIGEIHKLQKDVIAPKAEALIQKTKGKETLAVHYIASAARKFYQANSPLSGIIM